MTEWNLTETNEKFITYKKGMTAWFGICIAVAKAQGTTLLRSDYNLINRVSNDNAGKTDRRGFKGDV